jgi:hypothetical protein
MKTKTTNTVQLDFMNNQFNLNGVSFTVPEMNFFLGLMGFDHRDEEKLTSLGHYTKVVKAIQELEYDELAWTLEYYGCMTEHERKFNQAWIKGHQNNLDQLSTYSRNQLN